MRLSAKVCGRTILFLFFLAACPALAQSQRYPATGLVIWVDPAKRVAEISCNEISGFMQAMTMSFPVPDAKDLADAKAGTMIDFVLVTSGQTAYIESVHTHVYQGFEPDPAAARRLKLLAKGVSGSVKPVAVGDVVPDFALTAQDGKRISLSQFRGKITALNFVYTRCALPQFCTRSSNNFVELQKRFKAELENNLALLTITFDPVHDTPESMATYARRWNADTQAWHFLTGSETEVRRVCDLFGEDYFPDEGLMDHSLHTAIIDRKGRLIANLEGNEFSATQLGDLIDSLLSSADHSNQTASQPSTR